MSWSPALVLCYGDSNTFGQSDCTDERLPYAQRWTSVLQQALGETFIVMPEGLNGRTTVLDDPCEVRRHATQASKHARTRP